MSTSDEKPAAQADVGLVERRRREMLAHMDTLRAICGGGGERVRPEDRSSAIEAALAAMELFTLPPPDDEYLAAARGDTAPSPTPKATGCCADCHYSWDLLWAPQSLDRAAKIASRLALCGRCGSSDVRLGPGRDAG